MTHGVYVGRLMDLYGRTAAIRPSENPGMILAQFDDRNLFYGGKCLAYGWHEFPTRDWLEDE